MTLMPLHNNWPVLTYQNTFLTWGYFRLMMEDTGKLLPCMAIQGMGFRTVLNVGPVSRVVKTRIKEERCMYKNIQKTISNSRFEQICIPEK